MAKRPPKITIIKERTVHTYAELWHASACVLKVGQENEAGSSWQFLSSIVLSAFSFEAYLNQVGQQNFATWKGLERLGTPDKFAFLCEAFKAQFPNGDGKQPLQTIYKMLDFRNTLAHGKTEVLKPAPEKRDANDKIDSYIANRPVTHWESLIQNSKFAVRVREDVAAVLRELHRIRPEPKEHLFMFGMGVHSASVE